LASTADVTILTAERRSGIAIRAAVREYLRDRVAKRLPLPHFIESSARRPDGD